MLFPLLFFSCILGMSRSFPADEAYDAGPDFEQYGRSLTGEDYKRMGVDVDAIPESILEDAHLTVPELITKYGYPAEIHYVNTSDGYILQMHRIARPGAQPVYLQHGLLDSSAGWVVAGQGTALSYMLYDLGYDVWMGNTRGNRYSRNHTIPNLRKKKFWSFSFHESGAYDVPAMTDHIIEKTGFQKLHYIGHSQGTTMFWVMCHTLEGYCDKFLSMNALAPIAFLRNMHSPILRFLSMFTNQLEEMLNLAGMYAFTPSQELIEKGGQLICKKHALTEAVCFNMIFLITGYDIEQFNKTLLPVYLGHFPGGASTKQIVHLGQLIESSKFRQFDYGWYQNYVIHYGQLSPPDYDLSKVTAPVALHVAENDWLATPTDVEHLKSLLPHVTGHYVQSKFNHLDFLAAIDARQYIYLNVVNEMRKQEGKETISLI